MKHSEPFQLAATRTSVPLEDTRGIGFHRRRNPRDVYASGNIGGHFLTHPAQLDVPVDIVDSAHPVTEGVSPFTVHDELYIMETWPETYRLLASTPAEGGQPISWVREEGDGRVFYLSLGHNPEVYGNPQYRKLLTQGIRWASGER